MKRTAMLAAFLAAWLMLFCAPAPTAAEKENGPVGHIELLKTINGAKGKVVLVTFWATWCDPCRDELLELKQVREKFTEEDLLILAVSVDQEPKIYKTFVGKLSPNYPVMRAEESALRFFRIQGVPRVMVYDTRGKLAVNSEGLASAGDLRDLIGELLAARENG